MKTIRKCSAVLAVAAIAGAALALQYTAARQQIQAIYAKFDALTMKKDIAAFTKYFKESSTDDCVFIEKDAKGKLVKQARQAVLEQFTSAMPMVDKVNTSRTHVDGVTASNGAFAATVTSKVSMTLVPDPDGKPHTIVEDSKSIDTWIKSGSQWKLKSSKMVTSKITKDGQPIGS